VIKTTVLAAALAGVMALTSGTYAREPISGDVLTTEVEPTAYDQPVQPDLYLIRPGEQITITFVKSQLPALTLHVSQEGKIVDPAIGQFAVAGKTLTQLRALLMGSLSKVFSAPDMDISIGAPYQITASVAGAVASPGFYHAYTSDRVSNLITSAGGLGPNASSRRITLSGGGKPLTVDLDRAIELGDNSANPCLYAGTHISVPGRSDQIVQVVGAVHRAREIELLPGDDLAVLLALAGGLRDEADSGAVRILGDPNRDPRRPGAIRAGDILIVPYRPRTAKDSVLLIVGEIAAPGPYQFRNQMTLDTLVALAGGFTNGANRSRIAVFRRAEPDIWGNTPHARYPLRVGDIGPGKPAVSLMPGDSVAVPLVQGFVKVTGSVRVPGLYPFAADRQATYYLDMAGGITTGTATRQISLYDRVARTTIDIDPATRISDGDEIIVTVTETTP
jgi:polysaccharide biosynthesis/export protein